MKFEHRSIAVGAASFGCGDQGPIAGYDYSTIRQITVSSAGETVQDGFASGSATSRRR